jgi:hypothetical protein
MNLWKGFALASKHSKICPSPKKVDISKASITLKVVLPKLSFFFLARGGLTFISGAEVGDHSVIP